MIEVNSFTSPIVLNGPCLLKAKVDSDIPKSQSITRSLPK